MPSVRAIGLSFAYSDALSILHDVDVHLDAGWTGLSGPNGGGKTTFLRLVAGDLSPTSGKLQIEPRAARRILCQQEVEPLDPEVQCFAWATDGHSRRLHGQLRLAPDQLDRWQTLSPGERKRWQIGAALAAEPDVLLLDEPTNHLDAQGRGLLETALRGFRGVGLVVSHDRSLLDALTERTLRFEAGTARLFPGAYGQAKAQWEEEERHAVEERRSLQTEQRKLSRRLADARRDRGAAEASRSTGSRMRSRKDSDARGILAQTKAEWAEAGLSRRVELTRARLGKVEQQIAERPMEKAAGRDVFLRYERAPSPVLFSIDEPEVRVGEALLLTDVRLQVKREDRIRVAGRNGAGKSTLIGKLLEGARVPRERLLHLPQELSSSEGAALVARVKALPGDERGRVFSLAAALGLEPERLLATERPSPGEARKLAMALGLGTHAWVAVLDEPTNHLDLPSIERLERALGQYPGALVLVTHDDQLAAACTTLTWTLADGRVDAG